MGVEFVGLVEEAIRKALGPLSSGDAFAMHLEVPIVKVDPVSRTIEGVAQAEVVDASNEIISYAASKEAFSQLLASAGKIPIREMHANVAAGKSVGVSYDDRAKTVTLRARISRGAESTWQKILDGTLSMLSIGGTRLRSEIRADGVRWTSQFRLNEVSVVDLGSNDACKFEIVKSLNGVPTATDIIATDSEPDYAGIADACDQVCTQLRVGTRPLAAEISRALYFAGSPLVCNQLAPIDLTVRGPGLFAQLDACAKAMRMVDDLESLEKARTASVYVLTQLVSARDIGIAKLRAPRKGTGDTVAGVRAEIAKCVGQTRAMGLTDQTKELEVAAMALHTVGSAAGGLTKGIFTREELVQMRDTLEAKLREWQGSGRPRTPEYHTLEGQYFIVVERLRGK